MAAMFVRDLKEIIDQLPEDAKIVTVRSEFENKQDVLYSLDMGVMLDNERNEVVLCIGEPIRTEDWA